MTIYNKISKEQISAINKRLSSYERDSKNYISKDITKILDCGINKIESSPTKYLMFDSSSRKDL